jgi:hypothetical protein
VAGQELNLELIKEILNWTGWMIFGTARIQNIRRPRVVKWVSDTWAVLYIPMLAVFMASMKQLSISTFMVPHLNAFWENWLPVHENDLSFYSILSERL